MLRIKLTAERTETAAARFTVLMTTVDTPADVALAVDAPLDRVAGLLVARGFTAGEVLAALRIAAERKESMLGETEDLEVKLPHPDDVLVATRWQAVNRFQIAYEAALTAPAWERGDAEAESERWEVAAVRVAPEAAERVCLSAEVRRLRWARELEHPDAGWR
jgi:hypothetical protein